MDCTQVRVFKQPYEVCLSCLLNSNDGILREAQVIVEILCNFTNEALERQFANEQICAFLISPDLTYGNSTRSITVRF